MPEQLENDETQEVYWELQKFIVLALKANPNVLECLYSPIVEDVTSLGEELLAMRESFLSKLVFQTFSGYVASQFKKMQTDIRNQGRVKWKHAMHLIRLLLSGTHVLRDGTMIVDVGDHREQLLKIKRGRNAVCGRRCLAEGATARIRVRFPNHEPPRPSRLRTSQRISHRRPP